MTRYLALFLACLAGPCLGDEVSDAPIETLMPPDLPVTDAAGHSDGFVTRLRHRGPVIVSFFYTGCVSLCDVTNGILYGVDQTLLEDGGEPVTLVSFSIDPFNDSPAALRESAANFTPSDNWLWLTAGLRGTQPLMDGMGVTFESIQTHDAMFLVGDFCSFRFARIVGLPEPEQLIALARNVPECGSG
ncbi:SCO family protein [Paracoccus stylophorae]|uniref:SCO family protein n=1 Tax=Paracoccus stylophorae TaxID=659350 RepID=A0ABY7T080_9RHOB|nr:SCO family protein [Paracoccus stylophorae]WCR11946.1 SCO family protein [Paracoccus stylophorae]